MVRRNLRAQAIIAFACAAAFAAPSGGVNAAAAPLSPHPDPAVLSKYCFGCHNDKRKVGGLVLETKDLSHVAPDAETW